MRTKCVCVCVKISGAKMKVNGTNDLRWKNEGMNLQLTDSIYGVHKVIEVNSILYSIFYIYILKEDYEAAHDATKALPD